MRMSDPERRALTLRLLGTAETPGPLDAGWVVRTLAGTRQTLKRWRDGGIPPDRIDDVLEAVGGILPDKTKEPPEPAWLEGLVREIRMNREAIREAMLGPDQPNDAALVEMVKNDLRPLFEGLAAQFQGEVRQLLAERFGETDED